MRQRMSEKNVARLRRKLNLPIHHILVRGGTDHRKDLIMEDGMIISIWPDGTVQKSNCRAFVPPENGPENGPTDPLT